MDLTGGMLLLNCRNTWKNTAPVYRYTVYTSSAYYTHDLRQISYSLRWISHDHTHTWGWMHNVWKDISWQYFSLQLNQILKTEPVQNSQNRNQFHRIRYSEMDIPNKNTGDNYQGIFFVTYLFIVHHDARSAKRWNCLIGCRLILCLSFLFWGIIP